MLEVKGLDCGYNGKVILENVSFTAKEGDMVCLLGSNGVGKSTLIKTIVGLLIPYKGDIFINNEDTRNLIWKDRAKIISYIPQVFSSMFQYKVLDIVLMGRTSYLGLGSSPSKEDRDIAMEAIEKLKITHLKDKIYSRLSGGERQLVKIAQILVQQARIIVMDEPTNNLDFANQTIMLNHLKKCIDMSMTIIMATHFPDQAFLYGTKALLIKDGNVTEIENPNENLTETYLRDLYDIDLKVISLGLSDISRKVCLPVF
ncbi:MAG: ABC transporter ATP-binding protein [Firmicutes bacterium]|nr:ABC transporter ATP-binding protein [Bacillota bacterium]